MPGQALVPARLEKHAVVVGAQREHGSGQRELASGNGEKHVDLDNGWVERTGKSKGRPTSRLRTGVIEPSTLPMPMMAWACVLFPLREMWVISASAELTWTSEPL